MKFIHAFYPRSFISITRITDFAMDVGPPPAAHQPTAIILFLSLTARRAFIVFVEQIGFLALPPSGWAAVLRTCAAAAAIGRAISSRLPCSCGVFRSTMFTSLAYYRTRYRHFVSTLGTPAFRLGRQAADQLRAWPGPRWWELRFQTPVRLQSGLGDMLYGLSRDDCVRRNNILRRHGFEQYNRIRMSQATGFHWRPAAFGPISAQDFRQHAAELYPVLIFSSGPDLGYQPENQFDLYAVGRTVPRSMVPMQFSVPRHFRSNLAEELGI